MTAETPSSYYNYVAYCELTNYCKSLVGDCILAQDYLHWSREPALSINVKAARLIVTIPMHESASFQKHVIKNYFELHHPELLI